MFHTGMDRVKTCWVIFAICVSYVRCVVVRNSANGLDYLAKYNYFPDFDRRTGALRDPKQAAEALKTFQRFAGIPQTGVFDVNTKRTMNMPRCGMPDIVGNADIARRRRRRYALQGSKYPETKLTYRISKYTADISQVEIDSELARAWKVWTDVSPLTFTVKPTGKVDIDIIFTTGDHKDGNDFDGPSGVLAHAFYPQYGGDAHFDDAENWTVGVDYGVNLFQVAAHEFGHSIGLAHSDIQESLMAPFYKGFQPQFVLHSDDIQAVQALYGKPLVTVAPPVSPVPSQPPTVRPEGDNPCKDGKIDSIVASEDGLTYVFRGRYYYNLDPQKAFIFKRPMLISSGWPGLPNNVDAGIGNFMGHTYFFKGRRYWKYRNRELADGYPRDIGNHWGNIPSKNIDAIFKWGGNGKVYVIKGRHYYKVGGGDEYPRPLEVWEGLPKKIDAALLWPQSGYTYFFSGPNYYRFNDKTFSVDPGYPKLNTQWWFDCDTTGKLIGASSDGLGEMANVYGEVWDLAGVNTTKRPTTTTTKTLQLTLTCGATSGFHSSILIWIVAFSVLSLKCQL